MKLPTHIQTLLLVCISVSISSISMKATALQAMTETDMEDVSAISGDSILNISGSPAAGLTIDIDENSKLPISQQNDITPLNSGSLTAETRQEDHSPQKSAGEELRTSEDQSNKQDAAINSFALDYSSVQAAIEGKQQTIKKVAVFTTQSEITYESGNVQHTMRKLANGGVGIYRELKIDQLRIENLSGDHYDDSRSAGSVYLSNWNSRGDTKIIPHQ
jgi:hypothetical protein